MWGSTIEQLEYEAGPFHDADAACHDATWRFDAACECDDKSGGDISVSCASHTNHDNTVEQHLVGGYVSTQEFCDHELCVFEDVRYYEECFARKNHHHGKHGRSAGTCNKYYNICWKDDWTQPTKDGFLIKHGSHESLLCFQNRTVPVFFHNLKNVEGSYSNSANNSANHALQIILILWAVFFLIMVLIGRCCSDYEYSATPSSEEEGVELARRRRQQQQKDLPVAFASAIQRYYESGELQSEDFADDPEESEEWSG